MGAWDKGNFDNDDAADWAWELADHDDFAVLEDAFYVINSSKGAPEAPDCSIALAAAEVIAALRQHPCKDVPDEVVEYSERIEDEVPAELLTAALAAITKIKTESELLDHWEETGDGKDWLKVVTGLEKRLA